MGHFPLAPVQNKFLLVAIDYFTKWVEAEAFAMIKDKNVSRFLWKEHHFSFCDTMDNNL